MDDEQFEGAVDAAWAGFRGRLADRLAELGEDEILRVEVETGVDEDELEGAAPYLQFAGDGEMVLAEAVSNFYLDERFRLDEEIAGTWFLCGLWEDPDDEVANYYQWFEPREADRVAATCVQVLREVYGVAHPAFLDAEGLESDGSSPAVTTIEVETVDEDEPIALFPGDREALQEAVDAAMRVMFPDLQHDPDGDIPVVSGQSVLFVRVLEDRPAVEVFAEIVCEPKDEQRLAQEVALLNETHDFARFARKGETVVMSFQLVAFPFAPVAAARGGGQDGRRGRRDRAHAGGADRRTAVPRARGGPAAKGPAPGHVRTARAPAPRSGQLGNRGDAVRQGPRAAHPDARDGPAGAPGLRRPRPGGRARAPAPRTAVRRRRPASPRPQVAPAEAAVEAGPPDQRRRGGHRDPGPRPVRVSEAGRGGPRCIPENPAFTTTSEKQVWECLRETLTDQDVLLANLRLTDEKKDYEADLVVLMPGVGAIVLEVKGGPVWYDARGLEGQATGSGHRAQARRPGPGRQVRVADLRRAQPALGQPDPRRLGARSSDAVTLTSRSTSRSRTCRAGRCTTVSTRRTWRHGFARTPGVSRRARVAPTQDAVDAIVEILTGPIRTSYDLNAEAAEREAEADRLTQEQSMILSVTRLLRRVEVRGGAGSGKTVLALQQAKELTRGRAGERPAQRVALLCYSIGLAEFLKRQVAGWPRNHRPAFVGTFHEFGQQWGAPEGDRTDSDFWEVELPRLMTELVADVPDSKKYDAVIVDEAQDFADAWWAPVMGALRDEEEGGLYVYSDENQRIFARFGRPPVQLIPLVLDHNLRNTKQIHDCFGPLAPSRMYSRGGEGPAVRFVAASKDEAMDAADDEVEALLDAGWNPGSLCLLTTGHRHPEQQAQTDRHGHLGYWRSFWEGEDVFYGHVLGSKGLERKAVVLCVNESGERDRARERLYVGMSRATDMLVVVGDPDVIRRVGGDQVASPAGDRVKVGSPPRRSSLAEQRHLADRSPHR